MIGANVIAESKDQISQLVENISIALLGKPDAVRLSVVALLAEGHILIEDAPGVGKTTLAKAIAKSLDCSFTRLQFTPDMLPSDILGSSVFLPNLGDFEFRRGPIFTHVLLADEINRTTPRTQSALLEAMNEGQVSVEGKTYPLEVPFFVLATQNPFEYEGTFPLPENQLDRFTLCVEIGYPTRDFERQVLNNHRNGEPVDQLRAAITLDQLRNVHRQVREVTVEDSVNDYILDIIAATRDHDELLLGVSTRGALTLYRTVQALAFMQGRNYVIPDDVKDLVIPVLSHRMICKGLIREGQRARSGEILRQILREIPVPR
ncbi:MAG: MoxR family ATPase [Planctomycetota bacterium]|nr:MoxR family ATPase [Planctomycetota bacterium]MDA1214554.1 MoxR family ATPase [Planctomycetota bacterium]